MPIKDNTDRYDMPTTTDSKAMINWTPSIDPTIFQKLRLPAGRGAQ